MFHCLADWAKAAYLRAAHRAARPGARLLMTCFSDADPDREIGVGEAALRAALDGGGWTVATLEPVTVHRPADGGETDLGRLGRPVVGRPAGRGANATTQALPSCTAKAIRCRASDPCGSSATYVG